MLFISAHRPEFNKTENANRHADLLAELLTVVGFDAKVTTATGRYSGMEGECFAVQISEDASDTTINRVATGLQELANKYSQESILDLDLGAMLIVMSYVPCTWEEDDVKYFTAFKLPVAPLGGDYVQIDASFYTPGEDVTWHMAYLSEVEG